MARFVVLTLAVATLSCRVSSDGTRIGKRRPNVCITDEALAVTERPDFHGHYEYCTTGNRAVGSRAVIACLERQSGLPEQCATCYSWYKACVLQSCFSACQTPRPEVYCRNCSRTSCRGQFLQCSGTTKVFPGGKG